MALERQIKDIVFSGGLGADIDPKLLPEGRFSLLENCYQERTGELRRRNGVAELQNTLLDGASGTIDAGVALFSVRDELVLLDGENIYAYLPSYAAGARWVNRGRAKLLGISAKEIAAGIDATSLASMRLERNVAVTGNHALYTFRRTSSGSSEYVLIDLQTGAVVINGTITDSAGAVPFVQTASAQFGIVYENTGASNTLSFVAIENVAADSVAIGTPSNIITDYDQVASKTGSFDVIEFGAGAGYFAVAYQKVTTGDLKVTTWNAAGVSQNSYTVAPTTSVYAIPRLATYSSDDSVWVVNCDGSQIVKAYKLSSTLTLTSGPHTIETLTGNDIISRTANVAAMDAATTSSLRAFYTVYDATAYPDLGDCVAAIRSGLVSAAGAVTSGAAVIGNAVLQSTVWSDTSKNYFVATVGTETESFGGHIVSSSIVVDDTGHVSAIFFPEEDGSIANNDETLVYVAKAASLGGGGVLYPTLRVDNIKLGASLYSSSLMAVTIDTSPSYIPGFVSGGTLYFGSGILRAYDGVAARTASLLFVPPSVLDIQTASTGGSLTDGVFGIATAHVWTDAQGNEHYGPVSFATPTGSTSLSQGVTLSGGTSTQKIQLEDSSANGQVINNNIDDGDNLKLLIYRTTANGTVHYLETALDNDTTAVGRTQTLGTIDSGVAGIDRNAVIRTTGGRLSPTPAPPMHYIAAEDNYAIAIPADNRGVIWTTLPFEENVGPEWSSTLVTSVPEGGDNVAVAFLDGRPILFKKNEIRELIGTPPTARGDGGFVEARQITAEVGCEDRASVVKTPHGIMFKSGRGFYLLGRDLSATYIGGPVEDYNSAAVVNATLLENEQQVRFVLSSSVVLVWQYDQGNWSIFDYSDAGFDAFVDAVIWDGDWTALQETGTVEHEGSTTWGDGSVPSLSVPKARTSWIRLGAINGYQRLRRVGLLGLMKTASNSFLTVKAYYDYDDTATAETLVNGIDTVGGVTLSLGAGDPLQIRIHMPTQKVTSVMFEISWPLEEDGGNGEGLRLTGLSLEVGVKRKGVRPQGTGKTF